MTAADPTRARQFAVDVVRRLREAGYEAFWAGGCVRDQLMGRAPKDYDVATNATPREVQHVFRTRRTLAIGAAFGVISVLGPRGAGQVEVATFRCDGGYSDGRHPDRVTFSTAEQDALRRDFTINGLFFDPVADELIDYVGGREDLDAGRIRAIGDPDARIDEDKLRMLRAVRFAVTLEFELEPQTGAAIQRHAAEIQVVSGERIADELRRMLPHPRRCEAVRLLRSSGLLAVLLPESLPPSEREKPQPSPAQSWDIMLQILEGLRCATFSMSLAVLLRDFYRAHPADESSLVAICRRWKLANEETDGVRLCLAREDMLRSARDQAWPRLQRLLISPRIGESLEFAAAVCDVLGGDVSHLEFCRQKLTLDAEELNPAPFISGNDLKTLEIPSGPIYRQILEQVRDLQLLGKITDRSEALAAAQALWDPQPNG
jgi:tRNA nucleotidyltransferase/poly(A) polymerase